MKLKYLLCLALLLSCTFSREALANNSFAAANIKAITLMDTYDNEVWIELEGGIATAESCPNKTVVALRRSHPAFKEMYEATWQAFGSGIRLSGWVNGCSAGGVPLLTRMDLRK